MTNDREPTALAAEAHVWGEMQTKRAPRRREEDLVAYTHTILPSPSATALASLRLDAAVRKREPRNQRPREAPPARPLDTAFGS
jgi:hypothetical protein